MRLVGILTSLVILLVAPATAKSAVEIASGVQVNTPSMIGGTFQIATGSEPDQLLVVAISAQESLSINSIKLGDRDLTSQVSRAAFGTRTEVWTLEDPGTSSTDVTITVSGSSPASIGAVRLKNVHLTNPIGASATAAGNTAGQSASITLPAPGSSDATFAALTGASDATMLNLIVAPGGASWGTDGDNGPLAVLGSFFGGGNGEMTWSWDTPSEETVNAWTAAALRINGSISASVSTPEASSVTKTSASLASSVTDDGGGTITARGFVVCTCATPTRGGAGVTDVEAGSGTGAFSGSATGLSHGTTYTVRGYAVNGAGTSYSSATTFTTPNSAPAGTIGGPFATEEGGNLSLAVAATDADDDPLTYSWDVNGDGTFGDATGATPTLTWSQLEALGLDGPNTYSTSVRVSDDRGGESTFGPAILTVQNEAPTATVNAPAAVEEGSTPSVSLTDVTDPSAADVAAGIRFAYDFDNDGTYEVGGATYATATSASSATIPSSLIDYGPDTLTVKAAVIDRDGGISTYTKPIEITNVAPTATFNVPAQVEEGGTATVSFSDVDDPSAADRVAGIRFAYDFDNDGTYEIGGDDFAAEAVTDDSVEIPASFLADGPSSTTIRGAVIDQDYGITTYTARVDVINVAPTVALEGETAIPASGSATLTATLSDPGDDVVIGSLDWGDGTVDDITGPGTTSVSHTYLTPGTKTVQLTAMDSDGAEAESGELTLNVAAPKPPPPLPPAPDRVPDPPLTCPTKKLDFKLANFAPKAPFGGSARILGLRVKMTANGVARAKIQPRLRFRTRKGTVRTIKLTAREVRVRNVRELRFRLPRKVKRQLAAPAKGAPVTLVVRARLNHASADRSCRQAPIRRTLRTKVVRISELVALHRRLK